MKTEYTKTCECDVKFSTPQVDWDAQEAQHAIADFFIVCKHCGKRWDEKVLPAKVETRK